MKIIILLGLLAQQPLSQDSFHPFGGIPVVKATSREPVVVRVPDDVRKAESRLRELEDRTQKVQERLTKINIDIQKNSVPKPAAPPLIRTVPVYRAIPQVYVPTYSTPMYTYTRQPSFFSGSVGSCVGSS